MWKHEKRLNIDAACLLLSNLDQADYVWVADADNTNTFIKKRPIRVQLEFSSQYD